MRLQRKIENIIEDNEQYSLPMVETVGLYLCVNLMINTVLLNFEILPSTWQMVVFTLFFSFGISYGTVSVWNAYNNLVSKNKAFRRFFNTEMVCVDLPSGSNLIQRFGQDPIFLGDASEVNISEESLLRVLATYLDDKDLLESLLENDTLTLHGLVVNSRFLFRGFSFKYDNYTVTEQLEELGVPFHTYDNQHYIYLTPKLAQICRIHQVDSPEIFCCETLGDIVMNRPELLASRRLAFYSDDGMYLWDAKNNYPIQVNHGLVKVLGRIFPVREESDDYEVIG